MITQSLPLTAPPLDMAFLNHLDGVEFASTEIGEFLTIGRDPVNMLSIKDPCVSLRHARIERKDKGYLLRDLRSRNGTYLNGSRISEAWLSPGDRVRFAKSEWIFSEHRDRKKSTLWVKSRNQGWHNQLKKLPAIAQSELPVLICGPSGTGKELLARQLHEDSPRTGGPFVSVNCSALSESLVESELFGHKKGSFTGAERDRQGAFEAARGGTLFLDEIGDLPLSLQPKLLRALENQEVKAVGSDQPIETDVRIVAATHKNLKYQVLENKFRSDLYFRLHVVQVTPPALRERMEDFEDLLYHFAKEYRVRFSHSAIEALKRHDWPGNIRELKNVVARAKALFPAEKIEDQHVCLLVDEFPDSSSTANLAAQAFSHGMPVLKQIEKDMIIQRLVANRGNQRRTSEDLGMPKSTLNDRIRNYGIDIERLLAKASV